RVPCARRGTGGGGCPGAGSCTPGGPPPSPPEGANRNGGGGVPAALDRAGVADTDLLDRHAPSPSLAGPGPAATAGRDTDGGILGSAPHHRSRLERARTRIWCAKGVLCILSRPLHVVSRRIEVAGRVDARRARAQAGVHRYGRPR